MDQFSPQINRIHSHAQSQIFTNRFGDDERGFKHRSNGCGKAGKNLPVLNFSQEQQDKTDDKDTEKTAGILNVTIKHSGS